MVTRGEGVGVETGRKEKEEEKGRRFLIYLTLLRVLPKRNLRHGRWAWFGRSLCPHQIILVTTSKENWY